MKLNFDFYSAEREEKITENEKLQIEKYIADLYQGLITENMPFEEFKRVTEINGNILNWYDFKENAEILDLNPDLGQRVGEILKKAKNITMISNQRTKASFIQKRYLQNNNLEIFIGYFEEVRLERKFDYVTIIGVSNLEELKKKVDYAKLHLKQDGKILVAFDNKFGMRYWAGIKDGIPNQYDTITGKIDQLTLSGAEQLLKKLGLHYKVYYPLPNYCLTNVIFSEEYLPDAESIMNRDLICFDEEEFCEFSPRLTYIELLKENKNYFKLFANSYFMEIGYEEVQNEIRYANFEIYRKQKYNIKTIMKKDFVYKRANCEMAKSHIERIGRNVEILTQNHIKTLDCYENHEIMSKYAKNGISLDQFLVDTFQAEGKQKTLALIEKFKKEVFDQFEIIDKPEFTIFDKYKIQAPEAMEQLHFIKDGLIDLRGQNCFVIDGEFYLYDQEWYEENIPIEFLMYRFIFYNNELDAFIPKEELYQMFQVTQYVDVFRELDVAQFSQIRDEYVMNLYVTSVEKIGRKNKEFVQLKQDLLNFKQEALKDKQTVVNLQQNIMQLNEQMKQYNNLQQTLETERENLLQVKENQEAELCQLNQQLAVCHGTIEEYVRQLNIIQKSKSWKITKPLRYLAWVLNVKNKVKLVDRLMPPGSGMRYRYEKRRHRRILNQTTQMFSKYTDKETARNWANLLEKVNDERLKMTVQTPYDAWIKNNEPTQEELEKQRNHCFKVQPKISIIVPLYNTSTEFFRELLFFMNQQTYSNWELCLADGSPEPLIEIQKMIEKDTRIKYSAIAENKGISGNTNEALKLATGDYIGLLDHDDFLAMNCLYEVVKCIQENPEVEFIYTDEDKTPGIGEKRYDAHFKADFAPDTLRSQNYICHFSVFKKEVMDKLGGFRSEYDGAQDYDIFLRMSEIVEEKNIKHIPKILYHWRAHPASTATAAQGSDAKPWAFEAGRRAIEEHVKRLGLKGKVSDGVALGTYQVKYEVEGNPKVSILIPNKDGKSILERCIQAILEKSTYQNYEIIIIENNSEEEETFRYYEELKKYPQIKLIKYLEKGFNYSKIINFGVKQSDGDFIVQLNSDTEVITPDWLEIMIGYCQHKKIGAVGAKLYYLDETIQHAGILQGYLNIMGHFYKGAAKNDFGYYAKTVMIQDISAVTGACLMTRREIYEEVGYMNESLAVAFNDMDFCLKIRKLGYSIIYNPYVELWHYESKTRGLEDTPEKISRFNQEMKHFRAIWQEVLKAGDPYYNINLRLDTLYCEIRTEKINENERL